MEYFQEYFQECKNRILKITNTLCNFSKKEITKTDIDINALIVASENGNLELVHRLIKKGADLNSKNALDDYGNDYEDVISKTVHTLIFAVMTLLVAILWQELNSAPRRMCY